MEIASEQAEVQSEGRTNNLIWFNISSDFGIPCNDFSMTSDNSKLPCFRKGSLPCQK